MKVLFFARHFTYLRNFESVLRALAADGHRIHVATERDETFGGREMIDRLTQEYPGITAGAAPERMDRWYDTATKLRLGIDYLRYLDAAYDGTPKLRGRAAERVPDLLLRIAHAPAMRSAGRRRRLGRILAALERAVPSDPIIDRFVCEQAPDVVLITPLVGVVASPQLDYLYASMAAGIPTALCVWSWDHLSSKALIRTVPDRVFVWNDTQRREALQMHGVPDERIVVTGAQCFDRWFDRRPSRDRAQFCRDVGLPDDRPFLLWTCSALFRGSPAEAGCVMRWIEALRSSGDPVLRDVNILVRPHPTRLKEWEAVDIRSARNVAFWGGNPVDDRSRDDYFDSLFYSSAVVGLNTSAFIEAAIVGRQVYALLLPEFHDNQEGTIHFHYLLDVAGGLLHVSRSFEEHAAQIAVQLTRPEDVTDRSGPFVTAFVRPQGPSRTSTAQFVDAVTALAQVETRPHTRSAGVLARAGLAVGRWYAEGRGREALMSERQRMEAERSRAFAADKEARRQVLIAGKQAVREQKARIRAERERQRRAPKLEKLSR